jgi:hypothetical protein
MIISPDAPIPHKLGHQVIKMQGITYITMGVSTVPYSPSIGACLVSWLPEATLFTQVYAALFQGFMLCSQVSGAIRTLCCQAPGDN